MQLLRRVLSSSACIWAARPRIQFRDEADRFVELVWSSPRRGRAVFHHDLKGNAPFRPCLRNSLLQRLTLAVRRFRVFVRRLRMGLGLRGFLTPFRVLSLAMLVGASRWLFAAMSWCSAALLCASLGVVFSFDRVAVLLRRYLKLSDKGAGSSTSVPVHRSLRRRAKAQQRR